MTPQQVVFKYIQSLLPKLKEAVDVIAQLEEIIEFSQVLDKIQPIDEILSEEYQTVTDQTKKAEWVAERIAQLKEGLENNA